MMSIKGVEGEHRSIWLEPAKAAYPQARGDLRCDVAIIGGGITGLTTAFMLQGKDVMLLEAGKILEGVTGHTTAKLTSQHGLIYHDLIERFGKKKAKIYADANEKAKEWMAGFAIDHPCDLERKDAFVYTEKGSEMEAIKEEADAASSLGLPADAVKEVGLPFKVRGALRFRDQAQFHPIKYLRQMAKIIKTPIYEQSRVMSVKEDGGTFELQTEHARIQARMVVVATNFPFNDTSFFSALTRPTMSYVMVGRLKMLPSGMFIRASRPLHSIRTVRHEGEELLLFLDETHQTGKGGDTAERYRSMQEQMKEWFDPEILYYWSTQDYEPSDDVPFIGRYPGKKNMLVATGFKGWGLTHGTAAAMIFKELAEGREHPWLELYDPMRLNIETLKMAGNQAVEAVKGFASKLEDRPELNDLSLGDGMIVELDGEKVAAYKDPDGMVTKLVPSCTHMGCEVAWNNAEKTWDCPCHGSRFSHDGKVLHGPATKGLRSKDEDRPPLPQ